MAALLLDVLLAAVLVLLVPIGAWRGGGREILVTAAVLLGAALGDAWAQPWGRDLASAADLRPQAAAFLVAIALLLGTTLILGYGAAAALPPARPDLLGRLAGGFLAGLNGVLILGTSLVFLDRFLFEGRSRAAIDEGFLARALRDRFGWVLLVVAALAGLAAAVGAVVRALGPESDRDHPTTRLTPMPGGAPPPAVQDTGVFHVPDEGSRFRPVRVPRAADEGKVEPRDARPDAPGSRAASVREQTIPVTTRPPSSPGFSDRAWPAGPPAGPSGPPERPSGPVPGTRDPADHGGAARGEGGNGAWATSMRRPGSGTGADPAEEPRSGSSVLDDWLRRAAGPGSGPTPPAGHHEPPRFPRPVEVKGEDGGGDGPPRLDQRVGRCRRCGHRLSAGEDRCPSCGAVT